MTARRPRLRPGATGPWLVSRIRLWPIEKIRPLEKNPHVHDEAQVLDFVRIVARFGFVYPVLVHAKRRRLIDGHLRLEAARRLGLTEVPVVEVDHLSAAEVSALVLAANQITHRSTFDESVVAEYLTEMKAAGLDLALSAFRADDALAILARAAIRMTEDEAEPVPPLPKEPASRKGDLWMLGNHRVLCGSALEAGDLVSVLEGRAADAVWTDPPYGVSYESAAGPIANDDLKQQELEAFLLVAFQRCLEALAPGAPIYVCHADTSGLAFRRAFAAAGFKLSACLIWRKNSLVLSRGDYHWQHEPILYGWRPGAAHRWFGARDKTTIQEFGDPPFRQVEDNAWQITLGEVTLLVRGEAITVEPVRGSVFFEDKPAASPEHPTMKPVPLVARMLQNSARAGSHVLDPFGGSGSTLIACERLGMVAHLIDLEARYIDVAVQRWQNYTGLEATLGASSRTFEQVSLERSARPAPARARRRK